MPFQPGQSGNPSGRPKINPEVRELAREHTAKAIETLASIMLTGQTEPARVAASKELLDRGWGKPIQAIAGADGEGPVELSLSVKFVKGREPLA